MILNWTYVLVSVSLGRKSVVYTMARVRLSSLVDMSTRGSSLKASCMVEDVTNGQMVLFMR